MSLEVIDVSGLATIQDAGRADWMLYGVPTSGAMDRFALQAANALLGNTLECAVVEAGMGDIIFRALHDCVISVTGFGFALSIYLWEFPLWGSYFVRGGWTVHLQKRDYGMWAYLAMTGGIQTSPVLGSHSTYLRGAFGGFTADDRERLQSALHAVGLDGFARRPIDTLSGGQLQRALFARVLLQDAPIVLLDEPFTAIDEKTVHDLMHLVGHWHEEGRTVIAVLHDIDFVRRHFPETLLLAREPLAWGRTALTLKPENLERARSMPEAWDEHAPWHDNGHSHAEHAH